MCQREKDLFVVVKLRSFKPYYNKDHQEGLSSHLLEEDAYRQGNNMLDLAVPFELFHLQLMLLSSEQREREREGYALIKTCFHCKSIHITFVANPSSKQRPSE